MTRKKFFSYFLNALLVLIILILIIPGWRVSFQGWFQGLFMSEVEFASNVDIAIPESTQNWALFNDKSNLTNFCDFRGKPIILSFWATWCPPCRAELPELKIIHDQYKNQLNVIAVTEEPIADIEESGLNEDYSFLYSTPGIPTFFEIKSYPTLLIIDKEMKIRFKNVGAGKMDTEKNRRFLESLIGK